MIMQLMSNCGVKAVEMGFPKCAQEVLLSANISLLVMRV